MESDRAIALKIEEQLSGFEFACNLFVGEVTPIDRDDGLSGSPPRSIFCLLDGGPPALQLHGTTKRKNIAFDNVEVRIRGDKDGFEQGQADAIAARKAVHDSAPPAPGVTDDPLDGFIDAQVIESKPAYEGTNEEDHPEWSFLVNLKREETGP